MLATNSNLRICMTYIYDNRLFEYLSNTVVILTTIMLAIDSPIDDPNSLKQTVLMKLDIFVTTIFALEALIKICIFGFLFNGYKSYLRSGWNILDFFILIISIVGCFNRESNVNFYKIIRVLRVLRPLRMIKKN
jgi:hypothetical protein